MLAEQGAEQALVLEKLALEWALQQVAEREEAEDALLEVAEPAASKTSVSRVLRTLG